VTTVPILQVITSTQPRGAEIFAADLEHALRALGREVTTVALAPCDGSSLDVATLGSHALAPSTLRALRRAASSAAIVVAHGSTTLPACGLALMGTRVPFVYRNIGDPTYWARSPMRRLRVGAMLRRAAAVVAVSDAAADAIIERFGVARGRVTTIPTAVPEERFPPIDADERCRARAQLSLPTDGVVIAAVGALSPEKDLGLALEVTELAPDSHLLVAGDGPERARLERLANRRAPGRVHFTGWLADRGAAYAACDVVLQTSRSEGLPAVLI
jgi:glycosyltransferase involved in cell wall biosynthesis